MVNFFIYLVISVVFPFGNCQLKSSDFKDGSCTKNLPALKNASLTYIFTPGEYYIPLASKHYYRKVAEILLGRSAYDRNELNQMNIKSIRGKEILTLKGYNRFVSAACEIGTDPSTQPPPATKVICTPITSSSGTNASSISKFTVTFVYTDNESAIMVERCLIDEQGHGTRNYAVYSPNPILSNSVLSACLSTADDLNFDRNHAQIYNYGI